MFLHNERCMFACWLQWWVCRNSHFETILHTSNSGIISFWELCETNRKGCYHIAVEWPRINERFIMNLVKCTRRINHDSKINLLTTYTQKRKLFLIPLCIEHLRHQAKINHGDLWWFQKKNEKQCKIIDQLEALFLLSYNGINTKESGKVMAIRMWIISANKFIIHKLVFAWKTYCITKAVFASSLLQLLFKGYISSFKRT